MIVCSRIDSRLVHGQVVEAWLPQLHIARVVVADAEASADPLLRTAYAMALPPKVELIVASLGGFDFNAMHQDSVRTLILFRDVRAAVAAREMGLPDGLLNVGNVHAAPGRVAASRSVFLDESDLNALRQLERSGMKVELRAVPSESATTLPAVLSQS